MITLAYVKEQCCSFMKCLTQHIRVFIIVIFIRTEKTDRQTDRNRERHRERLRERESQTDRQTETKRERKTD